MLFYYTTKGQGFMNDYIIFTDSACDLSVDYMNENNIGFCSLTFMFEGDGTVYQNYDLSADEFYQKMKDGLIVRTSAVNSDTYKIAFKNELKKGNDILYLGFSSGLSSTYEHAVIAAEELKKDYPNNKIITVDTLSASAGLALLINLAMKKKNEGRSIDEVADFVVENRLNVCHWYTVDSLMYLKRGGRVNPAVAIIGEALGIKPIMHMDNDGKLTKVSTARGKKAATEAILKKYEELRLTDEYPVYISQGDAKEDAERLKQIFCDRYGVEVELIAPVGPVIGAHSGPGTYSIFFLGKER